MATCSQLSTVLMGITQAFIEEHGGRFLTGFRSLCVFSFICHCARTRAGVAPSRVGLSPASAAAMVRGENASAIWGVLAIVFDSQDLCWLE